MIKTSNVPLSLLACCLALFIGQARGGQPAQETVVDGSVGDESRIEETVRSALPYLQQQGEAWIEKRGCVSCHQIPFMLWSLSAAAREGFEIDRDQLRSRQQWSTNVVNFVAPAQKSDVEVEKTLASNIDTMNALLLAIPGDEKRAVEGNESWRSDFIAALIENQKPDGSWQACGQLPGQKRPKEETTQVTVLWSLLTLEQNGAADYDKQAALSYVENDQPVSTEWWVARLLLSQELEDGQVERLRAQLLANQRDDGGWGWLTDESSDALATGMALYGLQRTGGMDESGFRKAQQFLITTQSPDGSWSVPGTKESSRSKSTPTSDYWGTAWAVIGLLER